MREKILEKKSQCRKTERGDRLGFFNIHSVAKQKKVEGGTLWGKNSGKKSRSAEKTKRGMILWDFFNIHSVAKHQKIEQGTLWGKIFFRKKSHNAGKKTERGYPLVSPGMVLRGKRKNLLGSVH